VTLGGRGGGRGEYDTNSDIGQSFPVNLRQTKKYITPQNINCIKILTLKTLEKNNTRLIKIGLEPKIVQLRAHNTLVQLRILMEFPTLCSDTHGVIIGHHQLSYTIPSKRSLVKLKSVEFKKRTNSPFSHDQRKKVNEIRH